MIKKTILLTVLCIARVGWGQQNINDNPLPDATANTQAEAMSVFGSDNEVLNGVSEQWPGGYVYGPGIGVLYGQYAYAVADTAFYQYGGVGFTPAFDASAAVALWPVPNENAELTGQAIAALTYRKG